MSGRQRGSTGLPGTSARADTTRRRWLAPAALLVMAALLTLAAILPALARSAPTTRAAFTVTSVTPNAVSAGQRVNLTVSGTAFDPAAQWAVVATVAGAEGPINVPAKILKVGPGAISARITPKMSQLVGTYDVAVGNLTTGEWVTVPWGLAIKRPGVPVILKVKPKAVKPGAKLTITGRNFGRMRDTSQVWLKGCDCGRYLSWSTTKIVVRIPANEKKGRLPVKIFTAGGISKAKALQIK